MATIDKHFDKRYKTVNRSYDILKNIVTIGAIIGLIYTSYSWTKSVGASEARVESLFNKDNPIVKRNDLNAEITNVRHDMAISDTMVMRMSKSDFNSLNIDIKAINASLIEIKRDNKDNVNRIIDILKSRK